MPMIFSYDLTFNGDQMVVNVTATIIHPDELQIKTYKALKGSQVQTRRGRKKMLSSKNLYKVESSGYQYRIS